MEKLKGLIFFFSEDWVEKLEGIFFGFQVRYLEFKGIGFWVLNLKFVFIFLRVLEVN